MILHLLFGAVANAADVITPLYPSFQVVPWGDVAVLDEGLTLRQGVHEYEIPTQRSVPTVAPNFPALDALAMSDDARTYVGAARGGPLVVFDWATRATKELDVLEGKKVVGLAVNDDASRGVVWYRGGSLSVIDLNTGSEIQRASIHKGYFRDLATDPSGGLVVTWTGRGAFGGQLAFVHVGGDTVKTHVSGLVEAVAASPDGSLVATAHGTSYRLWDARTGEEIAQAGGRRLAAEVGEAVVLGSLYSDDPWYTSIAFAPDGKDVLVGTSWGKVLVVDRATWTSRAQLDFDSRCLVNTLTVSADGGLVGAICGDRFALFTATSGR